VYGRGVRRGYEPRKVILELGQHDSCGLPVVDPANRSRVEFGWRRGLDCAPPHPPFGHLLPHSGVFRVLRGPIVGEKGRGWMLFRFRERSGQTDFLGPAANRGFAPVRRDDRCVPCWNPLRGKASEHAIPHAGEIEAHDGRPARNVAPSSALRAPSPPQWSFSCSSRADCGGEGSRSDALPFPGAFPQTDFLGPTAIRGSHPSGVCAPLARDIYGEKTLLARSVYVPSSRAASSFSNSRCWT
jgi:hypothetical protein